MDETAIVPFLASRFAQFLAPQCAQTREPTLIDVVSIDFHPGEFDELPVNLGLVTNQCQELVRAALCRVYSLTLEL